MAIHNSTIARLSLKAALLATLLMVGAVATQAETIIISGLLLDQDGSPASGFTVRVYAGKNLEVAHDTTATNGLYTVVKVTNVDPNTLSSWHLLVEENGKLAFSAVVLQPNPPNTLRAKLPDLRLRSKTQARYSPEEAYETLRALLAIKATLLNAGELETSEANEQANSEASAILKRTDLAAEDPGETAFAIHTLLRRSADKTLPTLDIMREGTLMQLRATPNEMRLEEKMESAKPARREIQRHP